MNITTTYTTEKNKAKNHMMTPSRHRKRFDLNSIPISWLKKTLIKGIERAYLNLIKAIYGNPTTDIIQISGNVKAFL